TVLRCHGQPSTLRLRQRGVDRHHTDRRVQPLVRGARPRGGELPRPTRPTRDPELTAVLVLHGVRLPGVGAYDLTGRVHHGQRPHHETVDLLAGGADTTLQRTGLRTRTRTHRALGDGTVRGRLARRVPERGIRPTAPFP